MIEKKISDTEIQYLTINIYDLMKNKISTNIFRMEN